MNSNNILVSIVVPVYNSEKTIGKCLDSLINQTYRDIEIVCVNDCSTDASLSILKEYTNKDSRIVIIEHEKNLNAGGGRNSGIQASKGQYISFVDSDDWLKECAIKTLVDATGKGIYDIVSSPLTDYYPDGSTIREEHMSPSIDKTAIINHMMRYGLRMIGGLFRRSIFIDNEIRYPENVYFEDNAIGMVPFVLADNIKVIDESIYCYKAWGESSSRSFNEKRCLDRILTSQMVIDNAKKYGFYDRYQPLVDYRFICLSVYTIELLSRLPYIDALDRIKKLKKQIDNLLPNSYIKELPTAEQEIIIHPLKYLHREQASRLLLNIKHVLHKGRHSIVVCIKKLIGMDPTKSLFEHRHIHQKKRNV